MKADPLSDVKEIKRNGITVRIRPTLKGGVTYYVADYRNQGVRKLVWRSSLADARAAANEAIDKITDGQAEVLNLKSADAHAFTRARAILAYAYQLAGAPLIQGADGPELMRQVETLLVPERAEPPANEA